MKKIRKVIRKILLENTIYYEKLAVMLCTGELESVRQAIELAETMGYAHRVEYETAPTSSRSDLKIDKTIHRWTFSVPRQFESVISSEWQKRTKFDPNFVMYPLRNHSIGIKLTEIIEE